MWAGTFSAAVDRAWPGWRRNCGRRTGGFARRTPSGYSHLLRAEVIWDFEGGGQPRSRSESGQRCRSGGHDLGIPCGASAVHHAEPLGSTCGVGDLRTFAQVISASAEPQDATSTGLLHRESRLVCLRRNVAFSINGPAGRVRWHPPLPPSVAAHWLLALDLSIELLLSFCYLLTFSYGRETLDMPDSTGSNCMD